MTSLSRRVVIATAGHVDHGKTSLVRALTGTDTDRLPDEKRRGISIELGFATLADAPLSFIDVPGHKRLVHAMIAGVGGVDGVLLVVAADDGVMPQTREHLHVCTLLGIRQFVVAISKSDLVDEEMREMARADVETTLEGLGVTPRAVILTSVQSGQGVDALREALLEMAKAAPDPGASARVWLPIDRVFTMRGSGTVVTGTLTRGTLIEGQSLFVVTERGTVATTCRGLQVHGQKVTECSAPCRVAVNLSRVEVTQIARGDALTTDPIATTRLDVLALAPGQGAPDVPDGGSGLLYVGTRRRTARITHVGERIFHLALDAPLPALGGVGFVLRGFRNTSERGAVIGGGRVIDAAAPTLPPRRNATRWELRAQTLTAMAERRWPEALGGFLELSRPRALEPDSLEPRLGLEPGALSGMLAGKRRKGPATTVALPSRGAFTTRENVEQLTAELLERVAAHHARAPNDPGMSQETARTALGRRSGKALADFVIAGAVASGELVLQDGLVCSKEFAETAGPAVLALAETLAESLAAAALEGATETALGAALNQDVARVVAALTHLAREGRARRLNTLWFSEPALDDLRGKLARHFASHNAISVPELKELAGTSRKQAIPILEQLDREGSTRREGDLRVRGPGRRP